ncbi:hypothetical protein [Methylacidiphilum caldifontis]|uniref:hypothetical protein n=1 Tax=Methylacidiphilum caldifontis TaxID=2795386 RepID=UPI00141AC4B7|nr:hypothetical protein [Methylacidiphilum caldifontis]
MIQKGDADEFKKIIPFLQLTAQRNAKLFGPFTQKFHFTSLLLSLLIKQVHV